jgi:hypothetical protein
MIKTSKVKIKVFFHFRKAHRAEAGGCLRREQNPGSSRQPLTDRATPALPKDMRHKTQQLSYLLFYIRVGNLVLTVKKKNLGTQSTWF